MASNVDPSKTTPDMRAGQVRNGRVHPRGPDGRFTVVHGAYAGRRLLRRPDRRRGLVRQAEALRDAYAIARGFTSWQTTPGPLAALIEAAVELRLYRRLLFKSFSAGGKVGGKVPKRFLGVQEQERRTLATLGVEPAAVDKSLDEYVRGKYGANRES